MSEESPRILLDACGLGDSVDRVTRHYEGRYPVYDDHLWPVIRHEVSQRTGRACKAWYDPDAEKMTILVIVDGLVGWVLVETRKKYDDAALAVKVRRAVRATLNRVFGVR